MGYPGGKSGAGVYQRIINLMPPHDVYIEPFLGGGAIMKLKRAAAVNIGIDVDPLSLETTQLEIDRATAEAAMCDREFRFLCADGIEFLKRTQFTGRELVYCDPPYVPATLRSRNRYRFGMDDRQHRQLLRVLRKLPCNVILSGYPCEMYNEALKDWRALSFQAMTRGGLATECLWLNYDEPAELHDYRFLGETFRERERIKRKTTRWIAKLAGMPLLERRALQCALHSDLA